VKLQLALFAALVLAGCNTLPVGYDGLGRYPETDELVLRPDSVASYGRYVNQGEANRLFVGSDADFRARAFVKFHVPDTLTLDSVLAIKLILHPVDTARTDSFRFVCVPCSSSWDEASLTWVMRKSEDQWFIRGGDFRPETVATGALAGDSLVIDLSYAARDSASRAAIAANGLALLPAGPSDTGFAAFWSLEATTAYQPRTKVIYRRDSAVKYFPADADASIFDTMPGSSRPGQLLVGSWFTYRTWLRFRLDSVPREATIAGADLTFTPSVQYCRADSLSLAAYRLTERITTRGVNPQFAGATVTATYPRPTADSMLSFDIHSLVQFWTTNRDSAAGDTANFGLVVAPGPSWPTPFRVRLPDPAGDTLEPRLRVRYVMPPEDRFR
jgi:hypothetical protein